jgi:phage/plasmid-associated DNA primase
MWSRVLMHECRGVVKAEDRIPGYEDLLDAESPGMLARMVHEAQAFYDSERSWEGIIPESMIQATEEYRQDEDPNEDFGLVFVEDPELRMSSTEAPRRCAIMTSIYYRRLGQKAVTRRLKDRYRKYLLPVKGR